MQNDEHREDELEQENVEEDVIEDEEDDSEESEEESSEDSTDWQAEAAKWKAIAERNKKRKKTLTTTETEDNYDVRKDIESLKLSERKRQFGYDNGLSPAEADKVFKIDPNPTADTLKDPFVRAGLKAIRKQDELKRSIPGASSKSASPFGSKDFESADPAEKQKEFDKFVKSKLG